MKRKYLFVETENGLLYVYLYNDQIDKVSLIISSCGGSELFDLLTKNTKEIIPIIIQKHTYEMETSKLEHLIKRTRFCFWEDNYSFMGKKQLEIEGLIKKYSQIQSNIITIGYCGGTPLTPLEEMMSEQSNILFKIYDIMQELYVF